MTIMSRLRLVLFKEWQVHFGSANCHLISPPEVTHAAMLALAWPNALNSSFLFIFLSLFLSFFLSFLPVLSLSLLSISLWCTEFESEEDQLCLPTLPTPFLLSSVPTPKNGAHNYTKGHINRDMSRKRTNT